MRGRSLLQACPIGGPMWRAWRRRESRAWELRREGFRDPLVCWANRAYFILGCNFNCFGS
ncbi:hypothetical protein E1A91_A12G022500v1 [Gossypium mustelinum]|uniref:Uncharacterized protein n=1 Tax=Gossypium mustelinum TaxID=34275 RepID=A0A5D2WP59_GOSMU|nr:hypothetical protein E1A91_A12G022500v1 [Gossypium mustelinum]